MNISVQTIQCKYRMSWAVERGNVGIKRRKGGGGCYIGERILHFSLLGYVLRGGASSQEFIGHNPDTVGSRCLGPSL